LPAAPSLNTPSAAAAAARRAGILGTFWYSLAFPLPLALYAPLQTGAALFYMGALNRRLCTRIVTTEDGRQSLSVLRSMFEAVDGGLGATHALRAVGVVGCVWWGGVCARDPPSATHTHPLNT